MPKLAEFNRKLLHYKNVKPHRSTLLNILKNITGNLDKLSDFQTKGHGDILSGIISEISNSVGFIADSGEHLLENIISDSIRTVL